MSYPGQNTTAFFTMSNCSKHIPYGYIHKAPPFL